uniref:NAC domain-containing protein n=1 Tax=Ananas comosus var. bracteatus TaxID=296719 RepID=A0A6V7NF90_ANACO|nr:unnamed protein product [Ananas comosus var. bracteatus]
MAMPAGCKYTPKEEVLVGNVLRRKVHGEPPDPAAADCIREADVYGHHPAQLTALSRPRIKDPTSGSSSAGAKSRAREPAAEAEMIIKKHGAGTDSRGEEGENFEFRDSKKQKTDWLMEEYGLLPSSVGAEAAGRDEKEQVICKIYKTPAARRAEAKQSVAPATLPPRVSLQLCPSQPELPQQRRPRLQPQLSPPPWPALPPLLPASSVPDVSQPQLSPTSWSEQPLPPTSWPVGTPLWPPQRELMVQPLISMQLDVPWHDSMMAARDRTPFASRSRSA